MLLASVFRRIALSHPLWLNMYSSSFEIVHVRSAQGVSDLVVVASALADVLVRVLLLSPLSG